MLIRLTLYSTLLISVTFAPAFADGPVVARQTEECTSWQDCRDRALTAKEAGEFERFHDLAWRAVQKGPRNDAALLTLLARAQSLSGRPHDALVMLQRLASMAAVTDAAESEDFRRVRALPGWVDLQARIAEAAGGPTAAPKAASSEERPMAPSPAGAKAKTEAAVKAVPETGSPKAEPAKPAASTSAEAAKKSEDASGAEVGDAMRFTTVPFEPAGLAYDAVSNRFIIGDRRDRKLSVIGERSQRIATLAGEDSAGFGEVEAIAIDPREGDLWVASTPDGETSPRLHKLQLISGRQLFTAALAESVGDARLTDLAVDRNGAVFALDSSGGRLIKLDPGSRDPEIISTAKLPPAVSIAPASDGVIYLAGPEGLSRLEVGGSASPVKAAGTIDLAGLASIRWHRGSIVGVQRAADGLFQIVRIRLDGAGRRATRMDLLEKNVSMASPSSIAVTDDELFYLGLDNRYTASGGMDVTIRRVKLR
jgi:hypothetical protein